MHEVDSLLGHGAQSSVYSLKPPHDNKVAKTGVAPCSVERTVYHMLSTLDKDQRRWFCRQWKSSLPHTLVLSKCSPVDWSNLSTVSVCLAHVMESLEVLHWLGIVHHDVNPQNIMWHPLSKRYVLLDFGMATIRSSDVVDRLFLETREDRFSILHHLVVQRYPRCTIERNDYRRARKRWSVYFSRHPGSWPLCCRRFRSAFPSAFRHACSMFLSLITQTNQPLPCHDRESSILTKIMLSRFHLLFCLHDTVRSASFREVLLPFWKLKKHEVHQKRKE